MIEIGAVVKFTGPTPDIAKREFNRIVRESYEELGRHFHAVNLPLRFTYHGQLLLNYEPRSPKYIARKRKQKGHIDPNVWSGESRNRALATPNIAASGQGKNIGVKIRVNAPALNFKNPTSNVHPAEEIRRISQREVPPLVRKLDEAVNGRLAQLNSNKTVEIN